MQIITFQGLARSSWLLALASLTVQAAPSQTITAKNCPGYLAYFDASRCSHGFDADFRRKALRVLKEGVAGFGPLPDAPWTVCIEDQEFDGYLLLDLDARGLNQQTVHVNLSSKMSEKNPGSAFVHSRDDDEQGKPGKKDNLKVYASLTNFHFTDTPHSYPNYGLSSASPASEVLKTHTPHVAMYLTYCADAYSTNQTSQY